MGRSRCSNSICWTVIQRGNLQKETKTKINTKKPISEAKVSFALKYNLPLNVLDRISDTEPFVRASAVDVIQVSMIMHYF